MQFCTVCRHSRAAEIDGALLSGVGVMKLSRRFGVSRQSLVRHQSNHVAKVLRGALGKQVEEKGDRMVALFESVLVDLERLQHKAENSKNLSAALSSISSKIRLLELGLAAQTRGSLGKPELKEVKVYFGPRGAIVEEVRSDGSGRVETPQPAAAPQPAPPPADAREPEEPSSSRPPVARAPQHVCTSKCNAFTCSIVNERADDPDPADPKGWKVF
jgi:hypothetical protein